MEKTTDTATLAKRAMRQAGMTMLEILIVLAILALPVLVAACGGVPGNAVATVDGEAIGCTGYSVAACNSGCYGGGMRLAPDARRTGDGLRAA